MLNNDQNDVLYADVEIDSNDFTIVDTKSHKLYIVKFHE